MKKVFFALGTLATLSFAGCGGKSDVETDPNLLVNNDFETIAGWLPEGPSATLSRDKAHSGHYSIKVDAAHEYSLTYKAALGQLHDTRIKKINISAWTFVRWLGPRLRSSFPWAILPPPTTRLALGRFGSRQRQCVRQMGRNQQVIHNPRKRLPHQRADAVPVAHQRQPAHLPRRLARYA